MFLPTGRGAGAAADWSLVQTRAVAKTALVDAAGLATVTFDSVPDGHRWQVDRIVVSTTSGTLTSFWLYLDTVDPRNLVDGTNAGDFDVNDADAPIEVPAGSVLLGQWRAGVPGASATCRVHYALEKQGDGDGV